MRLLLIIISALIVSITNLVSAKTIYIPDDAQSIERALELTSNGDTVLIQSATVEWSYKTIPTPYGDILDSSGVTVRDVSVTIRGENIVNKTEIITYGHYDTSPNNRAMLKVQNASITFENLLMERPPSIYYPPEWGINGGPTGGIIFVSEDASLSLSNCEFSVCVECQGNLTLRYTTLKGHAWLSGYAYNIHETIVPTILLGPSEGGACHIINSTVSSDSDIAYRCFVVEEYNNSRFRFENARVYGGTYTVGYGSYPGEYIVGSDAISIQDCENVEMTLLNSHFYGGEGYDSRGHRFGIFQGGGKGGAGISLINSSVDFAISSNYSNLFGGEGGDGIATLDRYWHDMIVIHGGDGGSGLDLQNSTLRLVEGEMTNLTLRSGRGGADMQFNGYYAEPGKNGKTINLDESSQILGQTEIDNWHLFQSK